MKKILLTISVILLFLFVISCGETPETFKITYYGGGNTYGYPPVDNNKYESGEYAIVLGQNSLIKEDEIEGQKIKYEFAGWNTKSDNSGAHYDSGSKNRDKKHKYISFCRLELSLMDNKIFPRTSLDMQVDNSGIYRRYYAASAKFDLQLSKNIRAFRSNPFRHC